MTTTARTTPATAAAAPAGTPTATPDLVFDTITAYQRSEALKAAIRLDLFTAIDDGASSSQAIADACEGSERGVRMLADYLAAIGFLVKTGNAYQLTPTAAAFLSKRSPTYLGGISGFMSDPRLTRNFEDLADTVRRGTIVPGANTIAHENPLWVEFARSMVPMMMPAAHAIGDVLQIDSAGPVRVLDIAAGHGMYGITLAQRNPRVEVTAVDWPQVLAVASGNARNAGVAERHHTLPGDAFAVDFGTGFDVALVTNFLHHFDAQTCTDFLRKVAGALTDGGRIAIVEFVPNEDRVSPPVPAMFVINMLAGTPSGDVYTQSDLRQMLRDAGFDRMGIHSLPTPQTVVVAEKR